MRNKNYKNHVCSICGKKFISVRSFVSTCSIECYNFSKTKRKQWEYQKVGKKFDPDEPLKKLRRIIKNDGKIQ